MKILITGSTGLIGRPLTRLCVERGHTVYAAKHRARPEYGEPTPLDLLSPQAIVKAFDRTEPDAVIHLAAMTDVDRCEEERRLATKINHDATRIIAQEASTSSSFLLYASTDYVFDGGKGLYKEGDETNPVNWYGETKLRGEEAVKDKADRWCIARTSTPFGHHPTRVSFPLWLLNRLTTGRETPVVSDQYTSPTYTSNLAGMLLEIAERRLEGLLHTSGPDRLSRLELALLILENLGLRRNLIKPIRMHDFNWKAPKPRDSSLDVSKAARLLANKPEPTHSTVLAFTHQS